MKHVCLEIYGGCLEQHSFKGRLLLGTESQVDAYGVYPVEFPAMPHLPHRIGSGATPITAMRRILVWGLAVTRLRTLVLSNPPSLKRYGKTTLTL